MTIRLAIVVSHPIQHFAPWHREVARIAGIDLRVFFCCDWGGGNYFDPEFQSEFKWDVPLLEGYAHEFLPIRRRPKRLTYLQVDNPGVTERLDRFDPDVVKVFGYAYRTNWRVSRWSRKNRKPLLLYSDSNVRVPTSSRMRLAKDALIRRFYDRVDGALFVGDNNLEYHRRYGIPEERLFRGALPIDRAQLLHAVPDRTVARREIRERYGIPKEAFVVIFCGKYSPRKRPLDVVIAASMAAQRGVPVWSLLVGEGSERRALESYCQANGVNNSTLTGFVNQSSLPQYYVAADAIVVSSDRDPHPLVISEAATLGVPAIVSDRVGCIGATDTARPGINALVYPCGDRQKLSEAIQALYLDADRYREMSVAALEIAKTQDVTAAAKELGSAVHKLRDLGPRRVGRAS
jgi:glycosyltransferase involved in cell wall biosynthesis